MKIYNMYCINLFMCMSTIFASAPQWNPPSLFMGYQMKGLREGDQGVAVYSADMINQILDISILERDGTYFLKKVYKTNDCWERIITEDELALQKDNLFLQSWLEYKRKLKEEFDFCE